MCGVDVTDQLWSSYPILMKSHKWWYKRFCFVLDQSLVNSFILYTEEMLEVDFPVLTRKLFHL
jgi:hypothetical protein